ncbi:MAG TPA: glycosyltransferase family 4 protein, partial [Blastocatellia bacterium]|nr:glycosyltransferase family 4 protein [Blastocatellia bacterium]
MAIRILLSCQHSVAYGGVQHNLLDIARHLDRSRFEPIALCSPQGELPQFLARDNIEVRTIGGGAYWRYSHRQPLGTIKDVWAVAREIVRLARSERVRIVHTFDGMVFFAACLAKLQHRELRVVWLDSGFNLYPCYFRIIMRWCFRHAARVATITNIRAQQLSTEGLDLAKSVVIPNGTDFHLRRRPATGAPVLGSDPVIRVGIVGRIVPIKNFELFLRAARLVAQTQPHVRFSIVGPPGLFESEIEYYHRVRDLTGLLRLTDLVTFHEPAADIIPLLDSFDLLVSSSHLETFGRTLIEAMALS